VDAETLYRTQMERYAAAAAASLGSSSYQALLSSAYPYAGQAPKIPSQSPLTTTSSSTLATLLSSAPPAMVTSSGQPPPPPVMETQNIQAASKDAKKTPSSSSSSKRRKSGEATPRERATGSNNGKKKSSKAKTTSSAGASSSSSSSATTPVHPLYGVPSQPHALSPAYAAAAALSPALVAACGLPYVHPSPMYPSVDAAQPKSSWEGTLESLAAAASKAAAERASASSGMTVATTTPGNHVVAPDVRLPTQPLDRSEVSSPPLAKRPRADESAQRQNGGIFARPFEANAANCVPAAPKGDDKVNGFPVEDNNNIDFKRV